jgi:hypothetical protein
MSKQTQGCHNNRAANSENDDLSEARMHGKAMIDENNEQAMLKGAETAMNSKNNE